MRSKAFSHLKGVLFVKVEMHEHSLLIIKPERATRPARITLENRFQSVEMSS